MHHPIVPLLAIALVVAGCVTPPEGRGRYFHMYINGAIATEVDGLTNDGCQALINELKRQEVSKGRLQEGTVHTCSSEPSPRSDLPVKAILSHAGEERTSVMRAWSLTVCQDFASEEMKKNSNMKITCEVEKY